MSFYSEKKTLVLYCALAAMGIILSAGGAARGASVKIEVTGWVTEVYDPGGVLEGQINVYDTFTGFYKYESGTADINPSPAVGDYQHDISPFGIFLDIGGVHFESNPTGVDFLVEVSNDSTDRYLIKSTNNRELPNGAVVGQILWRLEDNTGTILNSDALSPTVATLSDLTCWTSNLLRIDGAMRIRAEIISAQPIPEPASAFLMVFGTAILITCRRKR
jgi:hypothetical protein